VPQCSEHLDAIRTSGGSADWPELASDYAERMLPQIFRKGDPVLDIALP
jgi:hypothetical protein